MLTTVDNVRGVPGLNNLYAVPTAYLNMLIGAADEAIRNYCKRDLELTAYEEFRSGDLTPNVVLRQFPVLMGNTTITSGSNGVALPTTTINVESTQGFHPGLGGDPVARAPSIAIQTGINLYTRVSYTGTTSTTFTGCSGGTGTLTTAYRVFSPVVWMDPSGYAGQTPNGFNDRTMLVLGSTFIVDIDRENKSNSGLLRRIGGQGMGFPGFYPENFFSGKLGAYRVPCWPRGVNNVKIQYSAGYSKDHIPYDLQYCATMLVAYMARNLPKGSPLSSENLGGYSFSVLSGSNDIPEIGAIQRTLARYRETSW